MRFLDTLSSPALRASGRARRAALGRVRQPLDGQRLSPLRQLARSRCAVSSRSATRCARSIRSTARACRAAAACAAILRDVLRARGRGPGFEREFFRRQAQFLTSVWNLATGADFQWPTTDGERPRMPPADRAVSQPGVQLRARRRRAAPPRRADVQPDRLAGAVLRAALHGQGVRRRAAARWRASTASSRSRDAALARVRRTAWRRSIATPRSAAR